MKTKLIAILCLAVSALTFSHHASAALSGSTTQGKSQSFSQTPFGAGLSIGLRANLAEDIFSDAEDKKDAAKDHIFGEIEAFGNQFFSGEIKQNFGGRLNLGYEIRGFRIFASGGYVASTADYAEPGKQKQSITQSAPFIGAGLGYDITKNIGLRLNYMFYSFDFKPKNSLFDKADVDVSALTIGLSAHF